ncbi:hypothetical protein EON63_19415 [archaeon]|nr:MAG: hypothetical protein EON63_19415 [archaeon]
MYMYMICICVCVRVCIWCSCSVYICVLCMSLCKYVYILYTMCFYCLSDKLGCSSYGLHVCILVRTVYPIYIEFIKSTVPLFICIRCVYV